MKIEEVNIDRNAPTDGWRGGKGSTVGGIFSMMRTFCLSSALSQSPPWAFRFLCKIMETAARPTRAHIPPTILPTIAPISDEEDGRFDPGGEFPDLNEIIQW